MKKLLTMMLMMASCVCFTACSDDEDDTSNPMVGTKWTAGSSSYQVYVIDFPTSSEFRDYWTDKSGNTIGDVDYGTYTYNNGNITFYNPNSSINSYKGKVQGDMLIVTYPNKNRTYTKK